ncbi:MAG TPA: Gfo/Idh/MocA family oxidoreductase [Planctomycetota bacterium]|mgnify:CR=1 FL=1|nr:Gfo/Idh/MocA family oxidoreductase [Planctomycetota bacterium]HRR80666.1 Gfo/Idh/MocA family oxidoreductase [Planctomycetota bacterium]HRT93254.1 Gfo/Idh/MocA family oxidoreductase [Planctomycetota bacterium]
MVAQTRRGFLRRAALGGAGLVDLAGSRSARTYAANGKLNIALIGCGGRGKWFVDVMPKMENVVALCDVNESKAEAAYKLFPDLPKFHDFRKMLDEMSKQIDAVIVSTPDHTHAVACVAAMKAGKHAFVEKPMAACPYEARTMRLTAEKMKVSSQMGNQGSASGAFRRGVELVQEGALGEVKEAFVWNSGGGPDTKEAPKEELPVPPYLKWDIWLGPAQDRPFHPKWLAWSGWRDFGTGQLGMWGSHSGYLAFFALQVVDLWHADPATKPRIKVQAEFSGINRLSYPKWELVHFAIPARGGMPPATIHWVNGGGLDSPSRKKIEGLVGRQLDWGDAGEKKWKEFAGSLLVGSKGMILGGGHSATTELLPADQFKDAQKDAPKKLLGSQGPERDWVRAAKGESVTPMSSFSLAGPYMEMMLLANVATLCEGELEYDPLEGKITNNAEADALLRRPYRDGWSL